MVVNRYKFITRKEALYYLDGFRSFSECKLYLFLKVNLRIFEQKIISVLISNKKMALTTPCYSEVLLGEPCPCSGVECVGKWCDVCTYCDQLRKEQDSFVRAQAKKRFRAHIKAQLPPVLKTVAITLTTQPGMPNALTLLSYCVEGIIKSRTYKTDHLYVKWELTKQRSPHVHISLKNTVPWRKEWTSRIQKQMDGQVVNVQFPKGVGINKWDNYVQKQPTPEEVEFYEKNNIEICYNTKKCQEQNNPGV